MDLDNIKKTWQETDLKPSIDDRKIRMMLNNRGRSAFNSILSYETVGAICLLLCVPVGYLVFDKDISIRIFFVVSTILGLVWQLYKLVRLKKVDLATMSITEVSRHIVWYRRAMVKELLIGASWFICFIIFFGYLELKLDSPHFVRQLIVLVVASFIGFLVALLIYRTWCWNNIKKIEAAIKEVEEYGEGNPE